MVPKDLNWDPFNKAWYGNSSKAGLKVKWGQGLLKQFPVIFSSARVWILMFQNKNFLVGGPWWIWKPHIKILCFKNRCLYCSFFLISQTLWITSTSSLGLILVSALQWDVNLLWVLCYMSWSVIYLFSIFLAPLPESLWPHDTSSWSPPSHVYKLTKKQQHKNTDCRVHPAWIGNASPWRYELLIKLPVSYPRQLPMCYQLEKHQRHPKGHR